MLLIRYILIYIQCYHCPKGKSSVHPKGYDYCMKCAKQKSMFGSIVINKSRNATSSSYKNIPRSKIQMEASQAINNFDISHPNRFNEKVKSSQAINSFDISDQNRMPLTRSTSSIPSRSQYVYLVYLVYI